MENLSVKTSYPKGIRYFISGMLILIAIFMFSRSFNSRISLLGGAILLFIMGVLLLTPMFGSYKTQISAGNGILWIRWPERAKISVLESEIERITLSPEFIYITRKSRKEIRLRLYDEDQKREVFRFLSEYAREKNIPLVNQDEQKN